MGLLDVLSGGCGQDWCGWRRCRVSKSWHSWQVLPSLPSGISTLSLPHSQVRFRISSAWSSSRFRLLSSLQCFVDQLSVQFGESGVGGGRFAGCYISPAEAGPVRQGVVTEVSRRTARPYWRRLGTCRCCRGLL